MAVFLTNFWIPLNKPIPPCIRIAGPVAHWWSRTHKASGWSTLRQLGQNQKFWGSVAILIESETLKLSWGESPGRNTIYLFCNFWNCGFFYFFKSTFCNFWNFVLWKVRHFEIFTFWNVDTSKTGPQVLWMKQIKIALYLAKLWGAFKTVSCALHFLLFWHFY